VVWDAPGCATSNVNTTVAYTQLAALICPSEGVKKPPAAPWATTNYVANDGGPGTQGQRA
jgi:hypothetical protein